MVDKYKDIVEAMINATIRNGRITGLDQYCQSEEEYPECYAKFIMTLYYKYKLTEDKYYYELAKKYLEYMIQLKNQHNNYVFWGLPFNWGATSNKDGFLLTTSFCIKAMYLWYKEGIIEHLEILKNSIHWCFTLICDDDNNLTKGFYYSPNLQENIYNATAIACGILSMCKELLSDEEKALLHQVAIGIEQCEKNGYWNYSFHKEDVDLLHQCYISEGMFDYGYMNRDEKAIKTAISGVDFTIKEKNFIKIERYLFKFRDKENLKTKIKYMILRILYKGNFQQHRFEKPRAWSYGAYVRTLAESYYFSKDEKYLLKLNEVLDHVFLNIIKDEKVMFKEESQHVYVRNTYHLIEALTLMEYILKKGTLV